MHEGIAILGTRRITDKMREASHHALIREATIEAVAATSEATLTNVTRDLIPEIEIEVMLEIEEGILRINEEAPVQNMIPEIMTVTADRDRQGYFRVVVDLIEMAAVVLVVVADSHLTNSKIAGVLVVADEVTTMIGIEIVTVTEGMPEIGIVIGDPETEGKEIIGWILGVTEIAAEIRSIAAAVQEQRAVTHRALEWVLLQCRLLQYQLVAWQQRVPEQQRQRQVRISQTSRFQTKLARR